MTPALLAAQDLADSAPLVTLAFGLGMLALAWAWWVHFPRYEVVLRRIPGALGRLPTAIFMVAMGAFLVVVAVVSLLT